MTTESTSNDPWIIEPYFKQSELRCPCCLRCEMDQAFLQKLKSLRINFDYSLKINSGFRCPKHNLAIGGKSHSQHLNGNAVDISLTGMSSAQIYKLLSLVYASPFLGIGIAHNFIHIDNRRGPGEYWRY